MDIENERLAYLVEAVACTGRRHIALGLANTFRSVNTAGGPTTNQRKEADAAEVAWREAGKALTDYRSSNL